MAPTTISSMYPHAQHPLIVGAPMGGYTASPAFAVAVSESGGLGFIGSGLETAGISTAFEEAKSLLSPSNLQSNSGMLPVGIGFLLFGSSLDGAAEAVRQHKPIAVWLFAAQDLGDYEVWARKMREVSPKSHVWIQIGSVADAVEVAQKCRPDVLVCQGADAGGHGLENGASVISLVPETADALAERGLNTPLVATGGIVDGRGVAATIALGAVGAAMGTRFLASKEVKLPAKGYTDAILAATDGGQATVRDKVFDDLYPKGNLWPGPYDGRAIRNLTWQDKRSGVDTDENRKRQGQATQAGDDGTGGPTSRVSIWAGTGVGLVKKVQPAAEIVEEVRQQASGILQGVGASK